jgi:hypothetical protein
MADLQRTLIVYLAQQLRNSLFFIGKVAFPAIHVKAAGKKPIKRLHRVLEEIWT